MPTRATRLFSRLTPSTERTLADVLRTERAGGILLLIGTVAALVLANSPLHELYESVRDFVIGPHALHLDLSVEAWAKDGLLAIFFFVVGLELKREIVVGELRRPSTAIVPIVAAIGGMAVPALLYVALNLAEGGSLKGWAVPTATDIAFAIAVLAVVGKWLPNALRAFLLTLAVVDDLLAIIIIAVFFSSDLNFLWLAVSAVLIVGFGLVIRKGWTSPFLLVPIAFAAWAFMHASGVHATIAGVALGMMVPAVARKGEKHSLAEHWEHLWRPVSAGFAVPVFALFAAGVAISADAISEVIASPVAHGVVVGLVIGKPLGIVLATFLVATFTNAQLDRGLSWWDVTGMGFLAGIGFTVSLLIGDLAFGGENADVVKLSVLTASVLAAALGAGLLGFRDRFYRRLYERRSTPVPLPANRMAKPEDLAKSVGVDPDEVGVDEHPRADH
ncbi:Na+/H+ antiporter NhaA [Demequina lignilytica]|uniref:Na(+)/H(+) antiporter NhaA n=1 Tax=Demequina lignilytica TaxID=3051663 RepID=A0AAW7M8L2_9MICO|nr:MULTISPECIES: Na+/H+ antiporter NhaA [unclassified Demequina]MDN4477986.1 Na+/H+ antiporter NhaA [Demequina sp. SYSU T00039-1]MDN4484235.1 Na+/H+ antiporter NhaA [Demequina sp. SYSU T0a273]MDN4487895.1 Na+/H+ antiporter NhaA [Demequina sp. SYSU T00039]MDN4490722.1 Na+/H+ antiporter NhaA [Demequina sp. SYSU T00068]